MSELQRLGRGLQLSPSRREILKGGLVGAGLAGAAPLLTAFGATTTSSRPLSPTFYSWIIDDHPILTKVNGKWGKSHPLHVEIAPVQGFGVQRFVAEAKEKTSTWDVYVGTTPFVEMVDLVDSGSIVPWGNYMPKGVEDDLFDGVKAESLWKGKLYAWPFLLDIIISAWNTDIVEKAGLDPNTPPKTWDDYIANAKKVKSSGAAPFGCTFDAHGWRSLAPITYSISSKVYNEQGLFEFTNPAAVEALQIMRQMYELANTDVLHPGKTDGGVNDTPDEEAFSARQVAYFVKYENAPIRMAANWPDPTKLAMGPLPKVPNGEGATVFWDTGSALFKYGQNKHAAGQYLKYLAYNENIWKQSLAGGRSAAGQLPPYKSLWNKWKQSPPDWMPKWASLVLDQLAVSKPIKNNKWGLQQFVIGQPYWQKYFTGDEKNPKAAMRQAMNAVHAAVKKGA